MERGKDWLRRLADRAELYDENPEKQPLLEVCGSSRVVIEYHMGVLEYSPQRITVKVKNGEYSVVGEQLSLCRMCTHQLLIRGRIQCVQIREGNG